MNQISEIAPRTTLHEELVGRLRDMIFSGELKGGDRVPEQKLCDMLGISRTPLREALKVLGNEGLLELLPNRGARVATLSEADIDEIFPVMGALEALSGELACARLTDAEFAEIRALHYQMALHHTRGELADYFRVNQQIHECILKAAANPTLEAQYTSLAGRIRLARFRANMTDKRWDQAMREHEEMLCALEARDGKRLSEVLSRHLENKRETVKQAIREGAGEAHGPAVAYD
ncbi:MAG: GntR family transcriptional regulator [Rhodospirillales bacterium]|nr:GntR family transcriptional regulator [Rhodospirillales bacterium]